MSQTAKLAGTAALLIGQIALQLIAFWLIDGIKNFLARRKSLWNTAWAKRDRIEVYDAACRMAHKPATAPFEEPQRSYHRRLKDAITDSELGVLEMRGDAPNEKTLVTRDALRDFAKRARWPELSELLREWDKLNPPKQEISGIPAVPLEH
jgi:hypothetical protein